MRAARFNLTKKGTAGKAAGHSQRYKSSTLNALPTNVHGKRLQAATPWRRLSNIQRPVHIRRCAVNRVESSPMQNPDQLRKRSSQQHDRVTKENNLATCKLHWFLPMDVDQVSFSYPRQEPTVSTKVYRHPGHVEASQWNSHRLR